MVLGGKGKSLGTLVYDTDQTGNVFSDFILMDSQMESSAQVNREGSAEQVEVSKKNEKSSTL